MASTKLKTIPLLTARDIGAMKELARPHRLNPRAIRNSKSLGDAVGMEHLGIHMIRIKPGDLTTEFHTHYCDEEFVYILSGRGIAEIGERKFEIGAGDFMGFIAGSLPHAMCNPYRKDLVYLLGGTRKRS